MPEEKRQVVQMDLRSMWGGVMEEEIEYEKQDKRTLTFSKSMFQKKRALFIGLWF